MTMPHLMNCGHSDEGWCLDCVKAEWERTQDVEKWWADRYAALTRPLADRSAAAGNKMRLGRLRAIESLTSRIDPSNRQAAVGAVSVLKKYAIELIAEVHRLRAVLRWISEHRHELHELGGTAYEALHEPDMGPPDFITTRET